MSHICAGSGGGRLVRNRRVQTRSRHAQQEGAQRLVLCQWSQQWPGAVATACDPAQRAASAAAAARHTRTGAQLLQQRKQRVCVVKPAA
eukprot:364307-Chlamydomonas_euryale.AAC.2